MAFQDLDNKFGGPGVKVRDKDLKGLEWRELKYLKDRSKLTPEQERRLGFHPLTNGGSPEPPEMEEGSDSTDPDDYSNWTKSELQAEIDERNAQRDQEGQLTRTGSKDHLIAILQEDDEAEMPSATGGGEVA